MKKILSLFGFVLAMMISQQSFGQTQCFNSYDANRFRVLDSRTVDVETRWREIYRLTVGFCFDLQWARRIAFERSFVCPGDNLLIIDNFNNNVTDRCWIQDITRLQ